jgi:hypothetical protein
VAVVDLDAARRIRDGNEPWMSKRELAEHLGFSVRWVEYRIAEGLPHRVFGGRIRVQPSAAMAWLETRERSA